MACFMIALLSPYILGEIFYNDVSYYPRYYPPFDKIDTIKEVTISNSVTSIGDYAFERCSGLTSLTLGNSIEEIGSDVIKGCDALTSLYILNPTPPSVVAYSSYSPFENNHYMTLNVYVPQGSLSAYQKADIWKNFWNLQEGTPTGIENIKYSNGNTDDKYYDLRGNGLSAPKKGLNIINGKKVMVKTVK